MAEIERGFPSRPRLFLAAVVAAAAVIVAPQAALADEVPLGQAVGESTCSFGAPHPDGSLVGGDSLQFLSSGSGLTYRTPDAGEITSWSTDTGSTPTGASAVLQLEVWRPDGSLYALVAISPPETVAEGSGVVTFPLSPGLGVGADDFLGLRFATADGSWARCAHFTRNFLTDQWAYTMDTATPYVGGPSVVFTCCHNGYVLNVAAVFLAGPHVNVPPTADNCKKDGWGQFTDSNGRSFKNQGDCVSFIETGGTNPAGG